MNIVRFGKDAFKKTLGVPETLDIIFGKFVDCIKDGKPDFLYLWLNDGDESDIPDIMFGDMNGDGYWDIIHNLKTHRFVIDSNYDGEYDTKGFDSTGDGWPDEFEPHDFSKD